MFASQLEVALDDTGSAAPDPAAVSVLMVDLDGFKSINDVWGHQVGDQVLEVVASRMTTALRPEDLVARFGGDEFAVLLPATTQERAIEIADRIRAAVRAPMSIDDVVTRVDASFGVAASLVEGISPGRLVRAADQAMYEAKRARQHRGRGRYVIA